MDAKKVIAAAQLGDIDALSALVAEGTGLLIQESNPCRIASSYI